mmetsp:Transcript_47108/g.152647  ORF Transcript_47108/g.152647 Transcript_47108/m.152647 type:complete len:230 (+) Transcript_47108:843-1532(+)
MRRVLTVSQQTAQLLDHERRMGLPPPAEARAGLPPPQHQQTEHAQLFVCAVCAYTLPFSRIMTHIFNQTITNKGDTTRYYEAVQAPWGTSRTKPNPCCLNAASSTALCSSPVLSPTTAPPEPENLAGAPCAAASSTMAMLSAPRHASPYTARRSRKFSRMASPRAAASPASSASLARSVSDAKLAIASTTAASPASQRALTSEWILPELDGSLTKASQSGGRVAVGMRE